VIARRDFVIGSACVASSIVAYELKPSRRTSLLSKGKKLSDIVPRAIPGWSSREVSDLVAPETPDSLLARLYGETVGRVYQQQAGGPQIMALIAHGESESNELQLHRPEVCYPAMGFVLSQSAKEDISVKGSVSIPARRLVAYSPERQETIIYWTRLGEYFPTSVTEQRLMRLYTAMHRYIPDGLLARFSIIGPDVDLSLASITQFAADLIMHVAPDQRRALIGTMRADSLLSSDFHLNGQFSPRSGQRA
jgi:EpsI family protein